MALAKNICYLKLNKILLNRYRYWSQFRNKDFKYDRPGNNVSKPTYKKHDVISCFKMAQSFIVIKQKARHLGQDDTTYSACETAYSKYRCRATFRKHIRNDSKKIGRPSLMSRNSDSNYYNSEPHIETTGPLTKHYHQREIRHKETWKFSALSQCPILSPSYTT